MTEENKAPVQDQATQEKASKKLTRGKKIAIALTLAATAGAAAYVVLFNQGYAPPLGGGGPCLACGLG